jgi:hypothetical protein
MRAKGTSTMLALLGCVVIGFAAAPAYGNSKAELSLVPAVKGSQPGFSADGSSIRLDGRQHLRGKIKKVVDSAGHRVTTDPKNSADDYSVEVDVVVPSVPSSGTVVVKLDLKNGGGKFKVDLASNPIFSGAAKGAGVAVNAVRVKDSTGTVIGFGGYALK